MAYKLNPKWKRKTVTITAGSALTVGHQVKLTIPQQTGMQATFNDLRFETVDGYGLPHWLESISGSTATVWVKLKDVVSASASVDIYMYYGNPYVASASNGTNTFKFFDDFADGDYTNNPTWTVIAGTWSAAAGYLAAGSGVPEITVPQTTAYGVWEWKFMRDGTTADHSHTNFIRDNSGNNYNLLYNNSSGWGTIGFWFGTTGELLWAQSLTLNQWYDIKVTRDSSGVFNFYIDGIWKATKTHNTYTTSAILRLQEGGPDANWDLFRIREYTATEPSTPTISETAVTVDWNPLRKKITVDTTTATPANYQVKFTIPFASQMATDFRDLRFVSKTGIALDYWTESYTSGVTADVWVELADAIGASSSDYIYMYYGNTNLTNASNGTNTFDFFDDFDDGDYNGWTVSSGSFSASNKYLVATATDPMISIPTTLITSIWEFNVKIPDNAGNDLRFGLTAGAGNTNGYFVHLNRAGTCNLLRLAAGVSWYNIIQNTWNWDANIHTFKFYKTSTGYWEYFLDGVSKGTITDTTYTSLTVANFRPQTLNVYIDNVRVRKYVATEPTYNIGSVEDIYFSRRKKITINNNSGGALTSYQVPITVTYAAAMQTDFDDLRFVDANNNLLPYWIEPPTTVAVATGGTVTTSGGYRIHTFTSSGTFAPTKAMNIEVYAWGGGGAGGTVGGWNYGSAGGAGGAANGIVSVTPTPYAITVGGGGVVNSTTYAVGGGGRASNNNVDNRYSGGGGGYSGMFITSASQANACIIAGGGGGGGSSRAGTGNAGGAGGGSVGQVGYSPYDGKALYGGNPGTQSAAGANASCDGTLTGGGEQGALQGGTVRVNSYGGGGGGGYWGGSAGGYSESNTMGGGGGGSAYYNPSYVSSAILTAGSGTTPGDSGNALRGAAGNAGTVAGNGSPGVVIIRYPLSEEYSTTAKFWIKVNLPNYGSSPTGDNIVYMYYGNPNLTSASNGDNTFEFFDDFERGTTKGGSLFDTATEFISTVQKIGSYSACDPGNVGGCCGGFSSKEVAVTVNTFVVGWSYYMESATNSKEFVNNHSWFGYSHGANLMYYVTSWNSTGIPLATGTWMKFEYQAPTTSTCKIRRIDTGGSWMGPFNTRYTLSTINFYMRSAYSAGPAYLDNCYIRKYVTTEPTYTTGQEEVPYGNASFTSNPSDARIWIDNIDTGVNTPNTISNLSEGSYNYTLKLAGYQDTSGSFSVIAGQTTTVPLITFPASAYFTSNPTGATVWVDDTNLVTTTPATVVGLTTGSHSYRLIKVGYTNRGNFLTTAGTTTNVPVILTAVGLNGSIWVEDQYLCYIDANNVATYIVGISSGAVAGLNGSLWIDGDYLYYIANGILRYCAPVYQAQTVDIFVTE